MPPRGVKKETKRGRQYEHIKEGLESRGESESRAEEIAARTVNKERARVGESRTSSDLSKRDISSGRRGGLRSGTNRAKGRTTRPALPGGAQPRRRGPLEDEQGAAPARGRPKEVTGSVANAERVLIVALEALPARAIRDSLRGLEQGDGADVRVVSPRREAVPSAVARERRGRRPRARRGGRGGDGRRSRGNGGSCRGRGRRRRSSPGCRRCAPRISGRRDRRPLPSRRRRDMA